MSYRFALNLLLAAVLLTATVPAGAQTVFDAKLQVDVVVADLGFVTTMEWVGPDDILVLAKSSGQVRRVLNGTLQAFPVLDVHVNASSERGLLGIVRDPAFVHNRYIYLYYTEATASDGGSPIANRVYRYTWNGSTLVDPHLVLTLPVTPGPNHDGGIITFGKDDRLYTIIGDLNRNGQLQNFAFGAAPDDSGVILRTDAEGNGLPDNPFYDPLDPTNPLNRYFAYGVRNSFGMTSDPVTGDIWDTENGPFSYDEINHLPPGANSGWELIMGPDERDPGDVEDLWMTPGAFYVDPQFSWASTTAPTAIRFADSPVVGCENRSDLFVGDNNCGQLYKFELSADRQSLTFSDGDLDDRVADNGGASCTGEQASVRFGTGFGIVTDIRTGPDGALYVVAGFPGVIYRIGPKAGSFTDLDDDGVENSCDCDDGAAGAFAVAPEIPRLRLFDEGDAVLTWDSRVPQSGVGTTHRLITGRIGSLRNDAGFGGACQVAEVDGEIFTDTRVDPEPGVGWYYLIAGTNDCGTGTYGASSLLVDPREALSTTNLPSCNR